MYWLLLSQEKKNTLVSAHDGQNINCKKKTPNLQEYKQNIFYWKPTLWCLNSTVLKNNTNIQICNGFSCSYLSHLWMQ